MTSKRMNGSEALIQSFIAEGTDTIFGYPGGAIMPVYDALYDYQDKLKHVLTRHEQGAVHAAQGYARVTGKVGICFTTSGPGATNILTGIADAMIDSTPLIVITAQVASPLLGTDAFQESDMIGMSMPVTKWNYQVTCASEIPEAIAKAFYIARSGRPGPVLIDLAKDAQCQDLDFEYHKINKIRSYVPNIPINSDQIDAALQLINGAKKPFVLVGHGVMLSGAEKELMQFLEKIDAPAGWTLLGNSVMPADHPLNMGMLGMHGSYATNKMTNQCDVLIAIGMRFDDRVTGNLAHYAKQAKVVHIEIDPAEINKIVMADAPIQGDAKKILNTLIPLVNKSSHNEWKQAFSDLYKIEYEKVIQHDIGSNGESITMAQAIHKCSEKAKGEAIMVTDVGQQQMFAARYFKLNKTRSVVTSGGLGTMGFGLPAAMGAKMGKPDRPVILFVGDGGFQMTLQELGTIAQENLAVKIVILNNSFLGMVRQWQELFFEKRYSFTELQSPDFVKLADSYGIQGTKISHPKDLDRAIETMCAHQGPYLLEIAVDKEDNVFPMVPTGESVSDIILENPLNK